MKIWKHVYADNLTLDATLNKLQQKNKHVEFVTNDCSEPRYYVIIYTVEDDLDEVE